MDANAQSDYCLSEEVPGISIEIIRAVFVSDEIPNEGPDFDQTGKTAQSAKLAREFVSLVLQREGQHQGPNAAVGTSVSSGALSGILHSDRGHAFESSRRAEDYTQMAPRVQERISHDQCSSSGSVLHGATSFEYVIGFS